MTGLTILLEVARQLGISGFTVHKISELGRSYENNENTSPAPPYITPIQGRSIVDLKVINTDNNDKMENSTTGGWYSR